MTGLSFAEDTSEEKEFRGESFKKNQYPASYNLPASIFVKNPIHLNINASFLYYNISQEGLEIASSATIVQLPNFSYAAVISDNQKLATQHFKYNPGFQVGIGGSVDNWDINAEYTWLQSKTTTNFETPSASFGSPAWVTHNWFQSLSLNNTPISATQIESEWRIKIHLVDLLASRPFYQSPHFIIKPFGGIRGAFIYQHLNMDFTETLNTVALLPVQPIQSLNSSKYWGIGPRFGADSSILLPMKFRLQADIAWSLLYSQFSVKHEEDASSTNQVPTIIRFATNNNQYLREMLEMGVGFGWGSYVCKDRYHIDFSASYDFMKFFEQNMMRRALDGFITQIGSPGSDLYLHGLNIKASFNF